MFRTCPLMISSLQGLTVSEELDLVFAASDKHRVNAWSLRTGERIEPCVDSTQSTEHPWLSLVPLQKRSPVLLSEPFPYSISAIQVTEDETESVHGLCLWVASGKSLYKYKYKPHLQH